MHGQPLLRCVGTVTPLRLAAAVACLVVAGCGESGLRLKVASWAGPEEIRIERDNLDEFERAHPGVKVDLEPIPANYREKILTSHAGGSAPDVFLLDAIHVPDFVDRDAALDLRPSIERLGVDLDDYYPLALDVAGRGNAIYALPKDFTPLVMYYNKDLFDAAGLPYPEPGWDWDDFLSMARRLTVDKNGDGRPEQYGTLTYAKFFAWPPWVWSAGGRFLSPDLKQAAGYLDSPETGDALQFLVDLCTRHRVAPTPEAAEAFGGDIGAFYTGRVAMAVSGHWWLPQLRKYIKEGRLRIGVAPIPAPPGRESVTILYESGWCVPSQTDYPEFAVRLAVFLSSPAANRRRLAQGLAIPANVSLAEEALRRDTTGLEAVFYDIIKNARAPLGARAAQFAVLEKHAEQAFEEAIVGGRPLRDALTDAVRRVDSQRGAAREGLAASRFDLRMFLLGTTLLGLTLVMCCWLLESRKRRTQAGAGWFMLAPAALHLAVFAFTPLLFSLYLAFHRWSIVADTTPFVGLANFAELVASRTFWIALKNTALYSLHVPVAMGMALCLAVVLNRPGRMPAALRALFFLPSVSSFVALAMVWKWFYNAEYGLLNWGLARVGIEPVGWLTDPHTTLVPFIPTPLLAIMVMSIWMSVGYEMVLFHAGLQGIPEHFHEAAEIDGAASWQRFRYITLPLLKPTTFFILVTSVIASFQVFTAVYVMTQGGPLQSTNVLVFGIYDKAWNQLRMGYACAMAWVLFGLLMVITWMQFRFMGREVSYT